MKKILTAWAMLMIAAASGIATDYSNAIQELSPWITNQLQTTGASSLSLVLLDSNQVVWATGFGLAQGDQHQQRRVAARMFIS